MTNGEKIKEMFPYLESDDTDLVKALNIDNLKGWWNTEYKESTTKNDLGVDCISRADAISAVSKALSRTFVEHEDVANKIINKLPSVTPQEPKTGHCKDCKWWKDKDGVYRRGIIAESKCPINRREVMEGMGYCFMFESQESENKE